MGQFRTHTLPMKAKNSASRDVQPQLQFTRNTGFQPQHRAFWGRCGVSEAAQRLAHTYTGTPTHGGSVSTGNSSGGSCKRAVGSSTRNANRSVANARRGVGEAVPAGGQQQRRSSRAGASSGRRRRGGGSRSRRSPSRTPRTSGSATSFTRSRVSSRRSV